MNMSDATYFTVSFDEGTPGVESSHHNMYSIGEVEFNEISPIDPWQFSDLVTDGVKDFLNCSYADINRPVFNSSNGSTAFGNMICNSMAERTTAPLFNGSVEGYFDEHRLSLSCDEATLEQIAVYEIYDHYSYIFGLKANVTTTECIGDMSDLGFFANRGESKEIALYLVCDYHAEDNTISISYMNIK